MISHEIYTFTECLSIHIQFNIKKLQLCTLNTLSLVLKLLSTRGSLAIDYRHRWLSSSIPEHIYLCCCSPPEARQNAVPFLAWICLGTSFILYMMLLLLECGKFKFPLPWEIAQCQINTLYSLLIPY